MGVLYHRVSNTLLPCDSALLLTVLNSKVCQSYASLGARGVTMLYASGDGGPGCSPDNITNFEANFPASCPL